MARTIKIKQGFVEFAKRRKGTIELINIQVSEKRKGYGTILLRRLEETIGKNKTIYLFNRKENEGGRLFYESNGYQVIALIPKFYTDNFNPEWGERSGDAYLIIKHL